jgi:hypothetical protein
MNFVIGRLSDFGKPGDAEWQRVREVQVSVAESDAHGSWVDCDDLNNKEKAGSRRASRRASSMPRKGGL